MPPNRTRRHFIRDTALAAASVSAATLLPTTEARSTANAASTPGACSKDRTPLRDLAGKVAFVTGGSSGIGLGIVQAFADAGMKVAFTYRNPKHLEAAMLILEKHKDQVHAVNVDVTDRLGMEKAAAETVAAFGKVHVLVNNAGVILPETLAATSYKDWDWLMNINVNGPFNGIHAFLPLIQSHGEGGHIITTSSILGLFTGPGAAAYATSKYALLGMMESLRAELQDTNIGTSVFCPGTVSSNIEETSLSGRPAEGRSKADAEEIEKYRRARQDRELMMEPLEAGRLVLRGMRNNDLYILTHAEYAQIMRDRSEVLLHSIPKDVEPTEIRKTMGREGAKDSIYAREREHRRCSRKV